MTMHRHHHAYRPSDLAARRNGDRRTIELRWRNRVEVLIMVAVTVPKRPAALGPARS
jgi:hypothetical protein